MFYAPSLSSNWRLSALWEGGGGLESISHIFNLISIKKGMGDVFLGTPKGTLSPNSYNA